MEAAVELENDAYYTDLSKQLSLLIMDEDEDLLASCPADSLRAFSAEAIIHHAPDQSVLLYEQALRRECKGTGVFILKSVQPRRKQRNARNSSYQKHSQDARINSQAPNHYSFKPRNG